MRIVAPFAIGCVFFAACIHADDKPKTEQPKPAEFTGRLDAVETVSIRPRVTGYIDKIVVEEGDRVKAGDVLAEIDPRVYVIEVDAAKAKLTRAEARGKLTAAQSARIKKAFATGAATQEEVDQAAAEFALAEAELLAAKAELERAKLFLAWTKITSPIDGVVTRPYYSKGNLAVADTTMLFNIVRPEQLVVNVDLDERTFLKWQDKGKDDKFAISVGLSNEEGFPHEAKFLGFNPIVDPSTGTILMRAALANPKNKFLPGMFVRVRVTLQPGK
jgi:RND family efflux transporter MFP subunit